MLDLVIVALSIPVLIYFFFQNKEIFFQNKKGPTQLSMGEVPLATKNVPKQELNTEHSTFFIETYDIDPDKPVKDGFQVVQYIDNIRNNVVKQFGTNRNKCLKFLNHKRKTHE